MGPIWYTVNSRIYVTLKRKVGKEGRKKGEKKEGKEEKVDIGLGNIPVCLAYERS